MGTLLNFLGTFNGACASLLFLACFGCVLWLWRKHRNQKRAAAEHSYLELELKKHEELGQSQYKQKKYSVAEHHFQSAAEKAKSLGNRASELQNRHRAYIAMSRTGSERFRHATNQLRKLVQQMAKELPADDQLLTLAQSNLQKLENGGLRKAAEKDLHSAEQFFQDGNYIQASRLYGNAAKAAEQLKDSALLAETSKQLARCLSASGNLEAAIKTLESAQKYAEDSADPEQFRKDIAWEIAFCKRGELEQQVKSLLHKTNTAYKSHDYETASELANQAVEQALSGLKADHWLTADALHHRACVKMAQGFYSEARSDFNDAVLILSEWPDKTAKLLELAQANLERCRREMGF